MIKIFLEFFNLSEQKLKYFILVFFEKLILLFFHFIFLNYLDRDLYGLFNQINFYSSYIMGFSLLGILIPILVSYKNSTKEKVDFIISNFLFLSIIVSSLLFVIIIIFNETVTGLIFGSNNYKLFLIPIYIIAVSDILSEYIILKNRIFNKIVSYAYFLLFRTSFKLFTILAVYILTDSFLIAIMVSGLVYLVFVLLKINFKFYNIQKKIIGSIFIFKQILKEGSNLLFIYILSTANIAIINIIISSQFMLDELAVYNMNFTISAIPVTIASYIAFYSLPSFIDSSNNTGVVASLEALFKDILLVTAIFIAFFTTIFLSYDYIIPIIVNKSEYYNKDQFVYIYILNFFIALVSFVQMPLLKKKKYSVILLVYLFSIIINISIVYFNKSNLKILTPIIASSISNLFIISSIIIYYLYLKLNR
jgi:O-antigen/teichoic acid export membrane protein